VSNITAVTMKCVHVHDHYATYYVGYEEVAPQGRCAACTAAKRVFGFRSCIRLQRPRLPMFAIANVCKQTEQCANRLSSWVRPHKEARQL
jgi:hypothetical protein